MHSTQKRAAWRLPTLKIVWKNEMGAKRLILLQLNTPTTPVSVITQDLATAVNKSVISGRQKLQARVISAHLFFTP
jgi:hypothetical protein